ncbi:MAG: c-type cytochrome [Thermodesulfobacteriota bacterium]
MKKNVMLAAMLLAAFPCGAAGATPAGTDTSQPQPAHQQANVKNGAHLYDNWPTVTGARPEGSHPLYPATGRKSGTATWRCKECHGWDYLGSEGRYRQGSHFTGIRGVTRVKGETAEALYASLTDPGSRHDFSAFLSPAQIRDLVGFLREGQTAIGPVIDAEGRGKGDAERGGPLYAAHCASCHGRDGNTIDFKGDKEGVQGVGWLANDNPEESIHKIRWGHPGSDMPSMLADGKLTERDAIDILTFSQSLEGR